MKKWRFTHLIKSIFFKKHLNINVEGKSKGNQQRVMTSDEALDQTLEDSFPASDPPGHFSKTLEDRILHSDPYRFNADCNLIIFHKIPAKRQTNLQICSYTNLGCE